MEKAHTRAGKLWRELGDVHALLRTLRVRAWIAVREGQPGPAAAREFMSAEPERMPTLRACRVTFDRIADVVWCVRFQGRDVQGAPDEDGGARTAYEEALVHVAAPPPASPPPARSSSAGGRRRT
ncbi:hypothetical protein OHA79_32415 [Streptomyces sp. NBC_00841]|uniref:hypothetical protein n=1 Tax=unclassified Streptomyces TaxID=2593676 RepID=UPI00225C1147|nr:MULTISPECIES: hypothetical protein [unclassified Streptomyces]MCX4532367.1 hypothetical protein [Streptomyces sp. NBC_01669]WSA02137.1 hypothetical protein OHA79_32415 [Streptomyces sp. NBC_00841]